MPEVEDKGEGECDRIQTVKESTASLRLESVSGSADTVTLSTSAVRLESVSGPADTVTPPSATVQLPYSSSLRTNSDGRVTPSDGQAAAKDKPAKGRREEFRPSRVRPPRPAKKLVKYPVIGRNNVAVPTHLYKVKQTGFGILIMLVPSRIFS